MERFRISSKDYYFLKTSFDTLEYYVVSLFYYGDYCIMEMLDNRVRDFWMDYRSVMARKGYTNGKLNDTGVRLRDLWNDCFQEKIHLPID